MISNRVRPNMISNRLAECWIIKCGSTSLVSSSSSHLLSPASSVVTSPSSGLLVPATSLVTSSHLLPPHTSLVSRCSSHLLPSATSLLPQLQNVCSSKGWTLLCKPSGGAQARYVCQVAIFVHLACVYHRKVLHEGARFLRQTGALQLGCGRQHQGGPGCGRQGHGAPFQTASVQPSSSSRGRRRPYLGEA